MGGNVSGGGWSDDRIRCANCARLDSRGRCGAHAQLGAAVDYRPVIQPRRCAWYQPGRDDPDQRDGATRWPSLKEIDRGR